jgi:hypothetical protein
VQAAVQRLPGHDAFIARQCAAPTSAA